MQFRRIRGPAELFGKGVLEGLLHSSGLLFNLARWAAYAHGRGSVGTCPNIVENNVFWVGARPDPHLPTLLTQPEMLVWCVVACWAHCWPVALFFPGKLRNRAESFQLCCFYSTIGEEKKKKRNCPG